MYGNIDDSYNASNSEWKIELYKLDVVSEQFVKLDEITTFVNLQFFDALNGIGGCSFILDARDKKATYNNLVRYRTQVVIRYNDVIVWFGYVDSIDGTVVDVEAKINVKCISYFGHLKTRRTDELVIYTQEDAGDIAWNLIETTQNKAYGTLLIGKGNIEATKTRDRTYENAVISEAIIRLTNVIDGFDFVLTPVVDANNKLDQIRFDVFQQLGKTREEIGELKLGEGIKSLKFASDGNIYTSVRSVGGGFGVDNIRYEVDDTSATTGYSLRENFKKFANVNVYDTLKAHTDTYLNFYKVERLKFDIELESSIGLNDFGVGDYLKLNIVVGNYLEWKGKARVLAKSIKVDETGNYTIVPRILLLK